MFKSMRTALQRARLIFFGSSVTAGYSPRADAKFTGAAARQSHANAARLDAVTSDGEEREPVAKRLRTTPVKLAVAVRVRTIERLAGDQ